MSSAARPPPQKSPAGDLGDEKKRPRFLLTEQFQLALDQEDFDEAAKLLAIDPSLPYQEVAFRPKVSIIQGIVIDENIEAMKFLLSKNANPNSSDQNNLTLLHLACHTDSLDMVKLLVQNKADMFQKANFKKLPIDFAKSSEVTYYLDIEMYKKKAKKSNPIYGVSSSEEAQISVADLRAICEKFNYNQAEIEKRGIFVMHIAVLEEHLEFLKELIEERKWNADTVDFNLSNILHICVCMQNYELIEYCVNACSPEALVKVDVNGQCPFYIGIEGPQKLNEIIVKRCSDYPHLKNINLEDKQFSLLSGTTVTKPIKTKANKFKSLDRINTPPTDDKPPGIEPVNSIELETIPPAITVEPHIQNQSKTQPVPVVGEVKLREKPVISSANKRQSRRSRLDNKKPVTQVYKIGDADSATTTTAAVEHKIPADIKYPRTAVPKPSGDENKVQPTENKPVEPVEIKRPPRKRDLIDNFKEATTSSSTSSEEIASTPEVKMRERPAVHSASKRESRRSRMDKKKPITGVYKLADNMTAVDEFKDAEQSLTTSAAQSEPVNSMYSVESSKSMASKNEPTAQKALNQPKEEKIIAKTPNNVTNSTVTIPPRTKLPSNVQNPVNSKDEDEQLEFVKVLNRFNTKKATKKFVLHEEQNSSSVNAEPSQNTSASSFEPSQTASTFPPKPSQNANTSSFKPSQTASASSSKPSESISPDSKPKKSASDLIKMFNAKSK